jgi:hypothetical protein
MTAPAGVCRFCGCSEYDACRVDVPFEPATEPCSWTDRTRSVCSACAPAAKAEAIALRTLAKVGYRSARPGITTPLGFVASFHHGFLVGWFGISRRSRYSRNPFTREPYPNFHAWWSRHVAWDLGRRHGAEASRGYQRVCGPLVNAPRKEVLQGSGRR